MHRNIVPIATVVSGAVLGWHIRNLILAPKIRALGEAHSRELIDVYVRGWKKGFVNAETPLQHPLTDAKYELEFGKPREK